jgi:transposase InsO family protein
VFSWDITKLDGPIKGKYFDCYVIIIIYSRYVVGAAVHASESAVLAAEMMTDTFALHGTPQVVHADRGTSMTSKTAPALLSDLEVTRSHSRPRVSNDNPFSEGWFKTLKYAPVFSERFGSIGAARAFMADFIDGYNHNHRNTGIGLNTPPTLTAASRPPRPRTAPQFWRSLAPRTRNGSPPTQIPRSSPCQARSESTNP